MYRLLIFLSLLLLAGCGGGETSNNSSLRTSYFIDAPVKGLNYECGDIKGVTDEKGAFSCSQTPITFKIGSLEIGKLDTFTSDNNVFPQDLIKVPREDINNEKVVALAQFLQSLDDDGDVATHINITDEIHSKLTQKRDFSTISASESSQIIILVGKNPISTVDAQKHLISNLEKYANYVKEDNINNENINTNPTDIIPSSDILKSVSTLDNDNDEIVDIEDTDDDNDNILDNNDVKPFDSTISVVQTYSTQISAREQTFIRKDTPDINYNNKLYLQLRSILGNFTKLGLIYFDIPTSINTQTIDKITSSTLSFNSNSEEDMISIYASNSLTPDASNATWNNTAQYLPFSQDGTQAPTLEKSYGKIDTTVGENHVTLTQQLQTGKSVFILDEEGNTQGELLKNSSNIPKLDIQYSVKSDSKVTVTKVADSFSSEFGDELHYKISLTSAPSSNVFLPIALTDSSSADIIGDKLLIFTPENWNQEQTITVRGKSDNLIVGNRINELVFNPLHSLDTHFNGLNPDNVEFTNYALRFNTIYSALTPATSGTAYRYTIEASNFDNTKIEYSLKNKPIGMSINENTGVITWQPDISQVGSYTFEVIAQTTQSNSISKKLSIEVLTGNANPSGIYVVPNYYKNGNGTAQNPYNSIQTALSYAQAGDTIYVRGGRYFTQTLIDGVNGASNNPITITTLQGERVKIGFKDTAFDIANNSSHLTFDGLELDGYAKNDHWEVLQKYWWNSDYFTDPSDNGVNGGNQGFDVDGNHIVIKNNIIHDTNQKAVNIYEGRYVTVQGNVVYNIGHASLGGGHGIMRKWERNFGDNDPDDTNLYRFDIYGNLVFGVEQRIYSRVFDKPYSNLTIDEGKPISVDETQDNFMKARIAQNLVIYGGIDQIKLKRNPNLEVYNNSVYPDLTRIDPIPDGITDVNQYIPNLKFYNNAVVSNGVAIDIDGSFTDNDGNEIIDTLRKYDNYIIGSVAGNMTHGITRVSNGTIFKDPANFDFSIVGALPQSIGVTQEHLEHLKALVREYGIEVKPSGWLHEHLKNTEYIVNNIPTDRFTNPQIGDSTIDIGHKAIFYDIAPNWIAQFGYDREKSLSEANDNKSAGAYGGTSVYQLVVPQVWLDVHQNEYTTIAQARRGKAGAGKLKSY
ncbi:MAG: hypothetical protein FNT15_05780 [Sulfurovum sp.]|nr:MAG: hypothetical protein FNT15_05780 [Sulfurovum sp.]